MFADGYGVYYLTKNFLWESGHQTLSIFFPLDAFICFSYRGTHSVFKIQVFIKSLTGKTTELQIINDTTVLELMSIFENKEGTPPDFQKFVFGGKKLEEGHSLNDYGIADKSTIHFVFRFCTGGKGPFYYVDESNEMGNKIVKLSSSAPKWRIVSAGLCIEGYCRSEHCVASGRNVISRESSGTFDVLRTLVKCPMCEMPFVPRSIGFVKCAYRIRALKYGGQQEHTVEWTDVNGDYQTWDGGLAGMTEWKHIEVEAHPMHKLMSVPDNEYCQSALVADECVICMQWMGGQGKGNVMLRCCHSFHSACAAQWMVRKRAERVMPMCPVCREDMA